MTYEVSYKGATLSSAVLIESETMKKAKEIFVAMNGGSVAYVTARKWKGI